MYPLSSQVTLFGKPILVQIYFNHLHWHLDTFGYYYRTLFNNFLKTRSPIPFFYFVTFTTQSRNMEEMHKLSVDTIHEQSSLPKFLHFTVHSRSPFLVTCLYTDKTIIVPINKYSRQHSFRKSFTFRHLKSFVQQISPK